MKNLIAIALSIFLVLGTKATVGPNYKDTEFRGIETATLPGLRPLGRDIVSLITRLQQSCDQIQALTGSTQNPTCVEALDSAKFQCARITLRWALHAQKVAEAAKNILEGRPRGPLQDVNEILSERTTITYVKGELAKCLGDNNVAKARELWDGMWVGREAPHNGLASKMSEYVSRLPERPTTEQNPGRT